MGSNQRRIGLICLVLLVCPYDARAGRDEDTGEQTTSGQTPTETKSRSTLVLDTTLGVGTFFRTHHGSNDQTLTRMAVTFESKIGAQVSDRVAVYFLSHISVNDFQATKDYSEWIFQDDDYTPIRVLLALTIPFALLADSQTLFGPGITYYLSQDDPSLYFDIGAGLSNVGSIKDESWIIGFGLFGGLGVRINDGISFGVRVVWAPPFTQTTDTDNHTLTISGVINLQ